MVEHSLPLFPPLAGCAVLVERGGCSYLQKAQAVQAGNATAMIAYDPARSCCLRMGTNAFYQSLLRDKVRSYCSI